MTNALRSADREFGATSTSPETAAASGDLPVMKDRGRMARIRSRVAVGLYYLACGLLTIVFLFPIAWSAFTSFFSPADASASPPKWLPSHLSFENYYNLANYGEGIWRYLGNSASVAAM